MPLDTGNALSQNTLTYTILMTSRSRRAWKGKVAYVSLVLSLMVLICLSISGACSSLKVTFTTTPKLGRPFCSEAIDHHQAQCVL